MVPLSSLAVASLVACAAAREVPDNLRALYDNIRDRGSCDRKLATGFWSSDEDDSKNCVALGPLFLPKQAVKC